MRRFPKFYVGKKCISVLRGIRLAVMLAITLALCFHGYRFYVNVTGVRGMESEIARKTKTIDGLASELATTTELDKAITPVEPPLDGGKFMSTFIRQITNLSVRTGCKLNTIKPKPIEIVTDPNVSNKETIKYKPIEVTIEMLTDYRGVNDFIAGLSKLPKVMKVTQLELSRRSADSKNQRIVLDAKLTLMLCVLEPGKTT